MKANRKPRPHDPTESFFLPLAFAFAAMVMVSAYRDVVHGTRTCDFNITSIYILFSVVGAFLDALRRLTDQPAPERFDGIWGLGLLSCWAAFAAWLLAAHPGARLPKEFTQGLWATAQVVFFAHLARRLCAARDRADGWRLLPEQCDRILAFLPASAGMDMREISDRLGGEQPRWALDRLVAEGLAIMEMRKMAPTFRFAPGAKEDWETLAWLVFFTLSEKDRALSVAELTRHFSSRRHKEKREWVARALFRLMRHGWIEEAPGSAPRYRMTRRGKEISDVAGAIEEFLPFDGSMDFEEIQLRLRMPRDTVQEALDYLVLGRQADMLPASGSGGPCYRSTWDPNQRFRLADDIFPPGPDEPLP